MIIFNHNVLTLIYSVKHIYFIILNLVIIKFIIVMSENPFLDFKNVEIQHQENLILCNINLSINRESLSILLAKLVVVKAVFKSHLWRCTN